jgi:hypothetical protein
MSTLESAHLAWQSMRDTSVVVDDVEIAMIAAKAIN